MPWRRDAIVLSAKWLDGQVVKRFFRRGPKHILVPMSQLHASSGTWSDIAERYITLGIEHILFGFDHLLFVAALLLLIQGGWRLFKTITAFTLAHSMTLALATLGPVKIHIAPVEAVIALSIIFVSLEILQVNKGRISLTRQYPWVIAFAFGLLHGLGFAGALSAIALPQNEIPIALLLFNVGVEIGQFIFVFVFLAACWILRQLKITWPYWSLPLPAYTIGTAAMYWFLQRFALMI